MLLRTRQHAYQLELADYAIKLTPWQLVTADEIDPTDPTGKRTRPSQRRRAAMRCPRCYASCMLILFPLALFIAMLGLTRSRLGVGAKL